jgi:hypothetical protein
MAAIEQMKIPPLRAYPEPRITGRLSERLAASSKEQAAMRTLGGN